MAVSEALTNVVRHAYGGQASAGRMFLRAAIVDGVLEAVVGDEGAGLPAPEDMPRTGLGLVIIARLTERLEFRDAAPGVELHMSFPLG